MADEQDQWALWVPVLFAVGIASYFGLPSEPSIFWVLAAIVLLVGGLIKSGRLEHGKGEKRFLIPLLLILLIPILGMGTAQLRSHVRSAPKIEREISFARLKGSIVDVSATRTGRPRLHIRLRKLNTLRPKICPLLFA